MNNLLGITYFSDYYHYVIGLLDRLGIVADRSTLAKSSRVRAPSIVIGEVRAPRESGFLSESALPFESRNGIIFLDGSFLRFKETVQVNRRTGTKILAYSYHYQRPGENFFVRFDSEEQPTLDSFRKPQYHLHTSAKPELHLPSTPVELEFVLQFIKANFFS
jgi:hypothetical protein